MGRMMDIKISKKILSILLVLSLVIIVSLFIILFQNEISTAKIEPMAPSYIDSSKIFLLSANSSYSHNGLTHCFVVHLSVRNDYTLQHPVDNETVMQGYTWFILYAKLYDKNGNQISSQPFIPSGQIPSYNQQSLSVNETASLDVSMATTSHDVDHYTLAFGWLGSFPAP
jgi:hypothetical protein